MNFSPVASLRRRRFSRVAVLLLAAATGLLAGCDDGPYVRDCTGILCSIDAAVLPSDLGSNYDISAVEGGMSGSTITQVTISPVNATITAAGLPITQNFTAIAHYRNGTSGPLNYGIWTTDTQTEGGINTNTGVYTANGIAGGVVNVQYSLDASGSQMATTTLTVLVNRTTFVGSTPMSAAGHFGTPMTGSSRAATLLYPLDQSVMPQNVASPDIQWQGGVSGDIYRVTLQKTHVNVVAYITNTGTGFTYDWTVDTTGWRTLAESDPADPVTMEVDRYDGTNAYAGSAIHVTLAHGSLAGAVYYWDLAAGRILRIRDDTAVAENFMPHPPAQPGTGSQCVACHSISRDGRYMAAEIWAGQEPSDVFDLTTDLTGNPPPTRFPIGAASWTYASFNPDSSRLIAEFVTSAAGITPTGLFLIDPSTGNTVNPAMGALPTDPNAVQPSWSPDGNNIAYVANTVGPGPTTFSQGDLSVLPVTGTDSFGSSTVIHHGSALSSDPTGGTADAYPSWTPDSHWLAFQHGPQSESDSSMGDPSTPDIVRYNAAIFIIAPTGGTPVRLTNASGAGATADAFFPNFSPFIQGGEYWLLFFSRRDYGNAQAGTQGTGRRQLWVTAVDTTVSSGTDPSHPPYWLPGQDVTAENISGFWAPQPCRPNASGCDVSSECCSGVCAPNSAGMLVCNPPPATAPCRSEGEQCGGNGDCCMGLLCDSNVCLLPPG